MVARDRTAAPRSATAPRGCAGAYLPVPVGIQVNWPAQIRRALSCSHYRVAGHQWVDGIHAIKIVSVTPAASRQTFWVDPATYLPVRALWKWPPGHGAHGMSLAGDLRWHTPTTAHLAALRVTVPSGFRRLRITGLPGIGIALDIGREVAVPR